jgi:threonyl-tRNA synthetase
MSAEIPESDIVATNVDSDAIHPEKGGKKEDYESSLPEYIQHRMRIWDECVARRESELAKLEAKSIKVTLADGKQVDAVAFKTTPLDIIKTISNSLPKVAIVAQVDGKIMWDLKRPLENDCSLKVFTFDDKEGAYTFWHSSAHILGEVLELEYKDANLCIGPPVEDGGFYYDVSLPSGVTVHPTDYKNLQKRVDWVVKQKQDFVRLELTKAEALEMFKTNKFKQEIISTKVADGTRCTAYRCGPLIDLCRGPHVTSTARVSAMAITKNSSAYWQADATKDHLQRVYGISFPDKAKLKEYQDLIAEAEKRDHRKIGIQQKLFFFHELSPGSCFWLPHGTRLYNRLVNYIKEEYRNRGYGEVITPNVYNVNLWKTSGHYQNYKENMFLFNVEGHEFAMKPMNCPGHCVMFDQQLRSYRELPLRMADFGVLHRNEFSGSLTGLTRVRRFQQDDAHIFCRMDQIENEVAGVLDFINTVYGHFGFKFTLCLSTRPTNFLGDVAVWDVAEAALKQCLDQFCSKHGLNWTLNPGDGAFYGPKIDIQLTDALKRKHQCGTCQLDFQLPIRFGLQYKTEEVGKRAEEEETKEGKDEKPKPVQNSAQGSGAKSSEEKKDEFVWTEKKLSPGFERPVMIHRAILGSVERLTSVLIEHTAGKWPFWLNPRQICVIPVTEDNLSYANEVAKVLHDARYFVDVASSNKQFSKKIFEAQSEQYSIMLVIGAQEMQDKTVTVRYRDTRDQVTIGVPELLSKLADLTANYK